MKIEKINDNQIRCTLTKSDLAERAIKLSEIAYGSEKAKGLFRDMMRQARAELGFDAEDIPLMIEAIPYSEHIVLIITKVDDPEELDTKFSNFAPGIRDGDPALDDMISELSSAAEALDLFKKIQDSIPPLSGVSRANTAEAEPEDAVCEEEAENPDLTRMFVFSSLANVSKFARLAGPHYHGVNSLYKDEAYGTYLLVVNKGTHTKEEYNRFCNMASEYASMHKTKHATKRFLSEHFEPILRDSALQTLSAL